MAVAAGQMHREVSLFERQFSQARREAVGYRRQPGPAPREAASNQRQPGRFVPGPATGEFQDGRSPDEDSLWMAGQVLTLADDQAALIAQEAQDNAAAIREAAEREAAAITQQATGQAAAIREAAEREAAELRTRLESMLSELGRVVAYVTDGLPVNAMAATAPALPSAGPVLPALTVLPATRPAPAATTSAPPATEPTWPATESARPGTRPDGPARPRTTPIKNPQKPHRQQRAMRIATFSTAALVLFALAGGVVEVGQHGFKFFDFRSSGTGQSPSTLTDDQFLSHQAAAHHVAPKGRHHRTSHQTVHGATNG